MPFPHSFYLCDGFLGLLKLGPGAICSLLHSQWVCLQATINHTILSYARGIEESENPKVYCCIESQVPQKFWKQLESGRNSHNATFCRL